MRGAPRCEHLLTTSCAARSRRYFNPILAGHRPAIEAGPNAEPYAGPLRRYLETKMAVMRPIWASKESTLHLTDHRGFKIDAVLDPPPNYDGGAAASGNP